KLEGLYGGRVTVGRLDAGWSSTALDEIQLYEAGPDAATPWAIIPDMQTRVPVWDLVRGEANPRELTLRDPLVTLRFDRSGKLLTRFPPRPEGAGAGGVRDIRLVGGRLILRQEGRPDLVVTDLAADLNAEGDRLTFTGKASEASWGNGTLEGWVN